MLPSIFSVVSVICSTTKVCAALGKSHHFGDCFSVIDLLVQISGRKKIIGSDLFVAAIVNLSIWPPSIAMPEFGLCGSIFFFFREKAL